MSSSGIAARAANSAERAAFDDLETLFLISVPFMRRRLARADDPANQILPVRAFARPRMHDENHDPAHQPNGLPAVAVGMRVWLRDMERILETLLSSHERQTVLGEIRFRFGRVPSPAPLL